MHETLKLCLVMLIPKFEGVLGFIKGQNGRKTHIWRTTCQI